MKPGEHLCYTRLVHPGTHEEHVVSRKRWHATIGQQVGGRRSRKISWLLPRVPIGNLCTWVIAIAVLLQVVSLYLSGPLSLALLGWCLVAELLWKLSIVQQESVLVVHSLGLQVETVWLSGRVQRFFLPMQRIRAVIVNEAVHSHTCFFYLALLENDSSKMTSIYQHLRPPLKVLTQVRNAVEQALLVHQQQEQQKASAPTSN